MKRSSANDIIARNILRCLSVKNVTQRDLANHLNVAASTVSSWCTGEKIPRMDKVDAMAAYFDVSRADLLIDRYALDRIQEENLVPLLGRIACGTPILAEENIEEYITLPSGIRADYALRCRGDSMIGAGIRDGDIVFIRQTPDVDDGQIAAVRLGDDATLKRVFHLQGGVMLMAEDKDRTRRTFSGPQKTEMEIMGQAVAYLHKLV